LYLVTSTKLPADATREVVFDASLQPSKTKLVLRRSDVHAVIQAWIARDADAPDMECLGIAWPVLFRVLGQLGFPSKPRDRFVEKIQVTSRLALLTLLVLYKAKRGDRLIPNRAGRVYEQHVCRRDRVEPEQLNSRNAWFRILTEIGFMLDHRLRIGQEDFVLATVRGYLDDRYLRLSLAGVMPDPPLWMTARPFHWKGDRPIVESKPKKGRYGVYDKEDLAAWKKVEGPFREMGFTILRQLGIGQFGRVYEAINRYNRSMPERIALKVDRIEKGKKKEAIQHADVTMQIARDLSAAPHVIRIYDAGKLEGVKYTYHVLQLVDGDTLDNLAGIAGTEHASVQAPAQPRRSPAETRHEYMTAVAQSAGEAWRWRPNRRFADQITLAQVLDLLTSILLWLEETHERGYAINDLKNGNLMMSRRGQLKGIDLDAYARIVSPLDRMTDFYFLGISILLLFVNLPRADGAPKLIGEHVLRETDSLRAAFEEAWSFGDVRVLSDGRVENEEVIALAVNLIHRCRDRTYVDDAGSFSEDINRLGRLKHSIFLDEIVVD
jgi:hypothetical protein